MRILLACDRQAIAWKNGGGVTRVVASSPQGAEATDFDWRISIAEVERAGPFSRFEDIDRSLTVLAGKLALRFVDDGREVMLETGMSLAFPGDVAVDGRPIDGPVRDLNVMARRGAWRAKVTRWHPELPGDGSRIAIATSPSVGFDNLDAALLGPGETLPADFSGFLVTLEAAAVT